MYHRYLSRSSSFGRHIAVQFLQKGKGREDVRIDVHVPVCSLSLSLSLVNESTSEGARQIDRFGIISSHS